MAEFAQMTTTVGTREAASELASSAVRAHLARSAQIIGPVESFAWRGGEFRAGQEFIVLPMTTDDSDESFEALVKHLVEQHPSRTPEIVVGEAFVPDFPGQE